MDLESSLKKLYSLHTFGIKLGLENIQKFLDYLGNPQKKLKTFHLAGSNGKGSTASFIASILMELHYKTGLYTSPHFVRFNERIKINNQEIPDTYIAAFVSEHENFIDEHKLTFFEVTTAIAFKYFYDQEIDYAVIETGLGGRLDATNVLSPLAVIITSISLEHTNILGNNLTDIAKEKAGIIKNNTKVFIGKLPDEAASAIKKKCKETNSKLFRIKDYIIENEEKLMLYTEELEIDEWDIPLIGIHQKYNAALASLAVSKTLITSDFHHIEIGIKNVIKNTSISGRYEFFRTEPDIIFDSAHNPEGVKTFIEEFKAKSYKKRTLLFGVMKDKNIKEMLAILKEYFDDIIVTEIDMERACKIAELKNIASEIGLKVKEEQDPLKIIYEFERKDKSECLVVLGSMYLIGEIKSSLIKKIT